jgi:hypothetical protein
MKRPVSLLALLPLAFAVIHACGGQASSTGSNTNWLKLCETQQDCGEGLSCECNVCQELCTSSSDCDIAGTDSRCATVPTEQQCGASNEVVRLCLKSCDINSDCGRSDLECTNGTCAPRLAPVDAGEDVLDATPGTPSPTGIPDANSPVISIGDAGAPLTTGTGYAVAESLPSPSLLFDTYAEFDDAGRMTGYSMLGLSDFADFPIGNAVQRDTGRSKGVTWGSWYGGPIGGGLDSSYPNGWHYAVGKSATTFPSGQVHYTLLGSTAATFREGTQQAQLEHASAVIDYDAATISFELSVAVPPTVRSRSWSNQQPGLIEVRSEQQLSYRSLNDGPERATLDLFEVTCVVVDDGNALVVGYSLFTSSQPDAGPAHSDNWVSGALVLRRE